MDTKNLIRVINEEIDKFDYLSMDVKESADEVKDIINSKDFKVNLVNDILTNNKENIVLAEIVGSKKENTNLNDDYNVGKSEFFYEIHMFYTFMGEEYELTLLLEGRNIKTEPEIEWNDIDVTLVLDDNGEEIDLDWLEDDEEMYADFIKKLVKNDFKEE